jgi:hypothetical protein
MLQSIDLQYLKQIMDKKKFWILTSCMVLVKLLIHLLISTGYELHRDEMLYFSMGNHLSWGFASTPPLMSFLAFIDIHVFGYHEFAVKFFPALSGAAIIVLIALFVKELGGKGFAVFTGSFAYILSTAMLRTSSLFMPVIFELFFWMLFLFFILKLINRQDPKYWMAVGISFGLAFLNKYSILFLGFSTVIAFLISQHRKLLFSRYIIYGAILSLCIALPNIIWQVNHKFPVITHMGELYRTQLIHVPVKVFLSEQILMNFSCILIWLSGLLAILYYKAEKKFRVFAWLYFIIISVFLIAKGKPYYTLGIYPMFFAFGGYFLEKYLVGKLKILSYSILAFSFICAVAFLPLGLPVLPQPQMEKYCNAFSRYITPIPMRNEDNSYTPIPQDYTDMTGWKELAILASYAFNKLDSNQKKDCIVYANDYGQAGALDFYGKKYHLPTPVCMSDSYIFWAPDSLTASNFIISDSHLGDIPRLFNNYIEIGEVNNIYFRENGIKIYLCQYPKPLLKEFFAKRIKENKEVYGY